MYTLVVVTGFNIFGGDSVNFKDYFIRNNDAIWYNSEI